MAPPRFAPHGELEVEFTAPPSSDAIPFGHLRQFLTEALEPAISPVCSS